MKRKIIILSVILVALVLPAVWLNTQTGVTVQGQFLRRTAPGVYGVKPDWQIVHDEASGRLTACLAGSRFSATVQVDGPHAVFTFDDGHVVEGRWSEGLGLIAPSGTPLRL